MDAIETSEKIKQSRDMFHISDSSSTFLIEQNNTAMLPPLAAVPFILVYFLYQAILSALPRLFLVPPDGWQAKIKRVIDYPKPIYLKVGMKRSSFRRRLVTASAQPSFYTNFTNNKLKLLPEDSANVNDQFMNAMKSRDPKDPSRRVLCGFFHPYANNGGGGEKVLWQAVESTLQSSSRNIAVIYTTNIDAEPLQILGKAELKFAIKNLDSQRIVFIYLRRFSNLIDGAYWKHFTLLGQLTGSVLLGLEAMYELSPDIWIDTIGLPGSYWLVKWILKIPIVAYVHYPIIQADMFNKLKYKKFSELKNFRGSSSDTRQAVKFLYWSFMAFLYSYLGSCVDLTLANGSWTFEHISDIWYMNHGSINVLYPPCSTESLSTSEVIGRENKLLYIAQFRPEKRHLLIVDEYLKFLNDLRDAKVPVSDWPKVVFLGSCKTTDDSFVLDSLKEQVEELNLKEHFEFIVDCSFEEVKEALGTCKFGLNAMWNEHFGIGVVEYATSGVVPIVHASAGPLLDILSVDGPSLSWENGAGFFFKSETDPDFKGVERDGNLVFETEGQPLQYPSLHQLLDKLFIESPEKVSDESLELKRKVGREYVKEKFSNTAFTSQWAKCITAVSDLEVKFRTELRDKVCAVY